MNKRILSSFLVVLFLISAMGCKKWRDNRETITSEDHTLAEASFNDIFRNALMATSPIGELLVDSCFTIQKNGNTFPQTVTVDFGNTGCEGLFGEEMKGKIFIVLNDSIHHFGATATIGLQDFYSNHYRVEGVMTIQNLGTSDEGHVQYQMQVEDGVITAEKAETGEDYAVGWVCDYHLELIETNNAQLMFDDLFEITGNASGVNQEGREFKATISEPLKKFINCRWPGSGVTAMAPADLKERDLSYGDCTLNTSCCDNVGKEIVRFTDQTVRMK